MSFTRVTLSLKSGDDFPLEIPTTQNMTHADVLQVAAAMVASNNKPAPIAVLTREQVAQVLVDEMGWEPEDVTAFWRICKNLAFRTEASR